MSALVMPGRAPGAMMPGAMFRQPGAHDAAHQQQQQNQPAEPKVTITLEEAERLMSVAASTSGEPGAPTAVERMQALDRLRAAVAEGEVTGVPSPPKGALSPEFHSRAFAVLQSAWEASVTDMARGSAPSELLESAYRAMEVRRPAKPGASGPVGYCDVTVPHLHSPPHARRRAPPPLVYSRLWGTCS